METALDVVPPQADNPSHSGLSPWVVDVKVERAADLDTALHNAAKAVLEVAIEHKTGILMTRVEAGRYIVQAHPEVPIGLIRQRHV